MAHICIPNTPTHQVIADFDGATKPIRFRPYHLRVMHTLSSFASVAFVVEKRLFICPFFHSTRRVQVRPSPAEILSNVFNSTANEHNMLEMVGNYSLTPLPNSNTSVAALTYGQMDRCRHVIVPMPPTLGPTPCVPYRRQEGLRRIWQCCGHQVLWFSLLP